MTPRLSVVLVEIGGGPRRRAALAALQAACRDLPAELIAVRRAGGPEIPSAELAGPWSVKVVDSRPGALTPERWRQGLDQSGAPYVAFTTTEFSVHPDWAWKVLRTLEAGATGAAGTIALARPAGLTATGTYLLRYSALPPGGATASRQVADIAGDCAGYCRSRILRHPDLLERGFWEYEFHRQFEHDGDYLVQLPEPLATFHGAMPFVATMQQRFRHGREFGQSRVREQGVPRWRVIAPAPVVPLVLASRIGRRILGRRRDSQGPGFADLARGTPALLLLSTAWALGEAAGACRLEG